MIAFLLFLIICELAALIIMALDGKLTGQRGPQGDPGVSAPASFAPAAPPVDSGIWELIEGRPHHWHHKSWVREGTEAWEAGRKRGHALRRGAEVIEGDQ